MKQNPLIQRAIEAAGSQDALAKRSGLSQQFISKLLNGERRVSGESAIALHHATGGQVPCWLLRPDMFPTGFEPPPRPSLAPGRAGGKQRETEAAGAEA